MVIVAHLSRAGARAALDGPAVRGRTGGSHVRRRGNDDERPTDHLQRVRGLVHLQRLRAPVLRDEGALRPAQALQDVPASAKGRGRRSRRRATHRRLGFRRGPAFAWGPRRGRPASVREARLRQGRSRQDERRTRRRGPTAARRARSAGGAGRSGRLGTHGWQRCTAGPDLRFGRGQVRVAATPVRDGTRPASRARRRTVGRPAA